METNDHPDAVASRNALATSSLLGSVWVVVVAQGMYSDRRTAPFCWYLRQEDADAHAGQLSRKFMNEWVPHKEALLEKAGYEYQWSAEFEREAQRFFGHLVPRFYIPRGEYPTVGYADNAGSMPIDFSDDHLEAWIRELPAGGHQP